MNNLKYVEGCAQTKWKYHNTSQKGLEHLQAWYLQGVLETNPLLTDIKWLLSTWSTVHNQQTNKYFYY